MFTSCHDPRWLTWPNHPFGASRQAFLYALDCLAALFHQLVVLDVNVNAAGCFVIVAVPCQGHLSKNSCSPGPAQCAPENSMCNMRPSTGRVPLERAAPMLLLAISCAALCACRDSCRRSRQQAVDATNANKKRRSRINRTGLARSMLVSLVQFSVGRFSLGASKARAWLGPQHKKCSRNMHRCILPRAVAQRAYADCLHPLASQQNSWTGKSRSPATSSQYTLSPSQTR